MEDLDIDTAAKVKILGPIRLTPVKDIHKAYGDLMANNDPEKFNELKEALLLAIDSAEAEFNILQKENETMNKTIAEWENEITNSTNQVEKVKKEFELLSNEKKDLEERQAEIRELESLKSTLAQNDTTKKLGEIAEIQEKNKTDEIDIENLEEKNRRRKIGLNEISHGLKVFNGLEEPRETNDEPVAEE